MKHCVFTCSALLPLLPLLAGCGGQDDAEPLDSGAPPDSGLVGAADTGAPKCITSSVGTTGSVPASFETVKLVFGGGGGIMTCGAAPCHGVNGAAPPDHPLELPSNDDQRLYTNLLAYVSKACNNTKLVDPCNPTESALVKILKGPCGKTPRMPFGCSPQAGDCIPDEYIAAVTQWIASGAPQR
jgi:hypothetical protein